jgi:TPP-dependent 2-oxoacid decarboxylase
MTAAMTAIEMVIATAQAIRPIVIMLSVDVVDRKTDCWSTALDAAASRSTLRAARATAGAPGDPV